MIILLRKSTIANCRMPKAIGTAVNLKVKLAQSRGAFDPDPMDRWNSNETKPTTKSQQSKRKKERKKKKKEIQIKSKQNFWNNKKSRLGDNVFRKRRTYRARGGISACMIYLHSVHVHVDMQMKVLLLRSKKAVHPLPTGQPDNVRRNLFHVSFLRDRRSRDMGHFRYSISFICIYLYLYLMYAHSD